MNDQRPCPLKKKVPLVLGWYIFYFSTFTTVIYLHAAMRMVMKPFYCFLSSFWQIASYFFFVMTPKSEVFSDFIEIV